MDAMQDIYNELAKAGKNNTDNLVKWMKDAKVIENTKAAEEKARKLFQEAEKDGKVTFDRFESVLKKMASEGNQSLDVLKRELSKTAIKSHMKKLFD